MNGNIGPQIMSLAKFIGWFLLIVCIIVSFVALVMANVWGFFILLIAGILGYVSSWALYGLGSIVDDVYNMYEDMHIMAGDIKAMRNENRTKSVKADDESTES